MVGCCAIGCSNRSEKGYIMKYFPKDPQRRKEWEIEVKRENWKPTNSSVLCENHFAPEMWEKTRVDGTKKLKRNAVPTIFSFSVPQATKRCCLCPIKRQMSIPQFQLEETNLSSTSHTSMSSSTPNITTNNSNIISSTELMKTTANIDVNYSQKLEDRIAILSGKLRTLRKKMQCTNRNYRKTVKRLIKAEKRDSNDKYFMLLKRIFNKDQIYAMEHKMSYHKWSNETIQKALALKFACGNNGYQELLKNKIPLPSIRTLTRRLENLKVVVVVKT